MSEQLGLDGVAEQAAPDQQEPTRREVALAGMLLGFVVPGFDSWQRAPQALRVEAIKAARAALGAVTAKKEEIGL